MMRPQDPRYKPAPDQYKAHRCTRCKHLRYPDERPGDGCRWCPCTTHAVPADEVSEAERADQARHDEQYDATMTALGGAT